MGGEGGSFLLALAIISPFLECYFDEQVRAFVKKAFILAIPL